MSRKRLLLSEDGKIRELSVAIVIRWAIYVTLDETVLLNIIKGDISPIVDSYPVIFDTFEDCQKYITSGDGLADINEWNKKGMKWAMFPIEVLDGR